MRSFSKNTIEFAWITKMLLLLFFISIFLFRSFSYAQDRQISLNEIKDYFGEQNLGLIPQQGTISFFAKLDSKKEIMDALTTGPLGGCDNGNRCFRFEFVPWGTIDTGFAVIIGNDSATCHNAGSYSINRYRFLNPSGFNVNTWYHFALVWDMTKNNAKGYVDGREAFNYTTTKWPTRYYEVKPGIGFDTLRKWDGGLAEVSVWNRALTPGEINSLKNGIVNLNDPELKRYWNSPANYTFDSHKNLLNITATCFLQDHKGFMWIGTNDGLKRFDGLHNRHYFSSPAEPDALHTNYITALFEDSHKRMWVGTFDEGVLLFKQYANIFYSFNKHLGKDAQRLTDIWNISEDKNKNIIVQARQGLYRLNEKTNQFEKYDYPASGIDEKIYSSVLDSKGNEWLSTENGIKYFDILSNKLYDRHNNPEHIPTLDILSPSSIIADRQDNLWIGDGTKSILYKYSIASNKIQTFFFPASLKTNAFTTKKIKPGLGNIFIDSHNSVWLSIHGLGVAKYDSDTNNFLLVISDNNNYSSHDSSFIPRYRNFPMIEDREGNLWVGGFTNYIWFHSGNKSASLPPLDVTFTNFHAYDKNFAYIPDHFIDSVLDNKLPIHLNYRYNTFDVQFASLQFSDADRLKYYIRMEGIDKDWVDAENTRMGGFHDLKPGKYRFHVKCANQFGISCKRETILEIIIAPPFWQTWWFRTIAGVLVLGFLFWLVNLRIRYVRKKDAENAATDLQMAALETKALRSQMNPHFIFNALNAIKKFMLKNDTINAERYLSKFAKLIRLILDNTRENKVVLENEIQLLDLYLQLEQLRFEDKLEYKIQVDEKINVQETEIPSMLIQPFVENAIVHGILHKKSKGVVKVIFIQYTHWIEVVIEDDGVGREKAGALENQDKEFHKSLAIPITQERLKALSRNKNIPAGLRIDDLTDTSGQPCGTRVTICIPTE